MPHLRSPALLLLALPLGSCTPVVAGSADDGQPDVGETDGLDGLDGSDGADGTDGTPQAVGGALFDTDRLIEVELEMTDGAWAALRRQTRSMFDVLAGDCMSEPAQSPYTWFSATATIDGERVEDVEVKKKGFIGSLSTERPGIKIDFDNAVDDRLFHGLERMTLNNMRQDGTLIRTCLAYEHFRAVGVPAPRCSFVHLTVNDEDLGIYAHVETVNDRFVERVAGTDDVPLFEGTLSDLRPGWTATYDLDSDAADYAQLEPLVAAIETGDLDEIAQVVDIDAFLRFSAAEAMTGHWDGYGWNTNNYFLYIDPTDGLARWVPWGPDAAWSSRNPGGGLNWVAADSALPRALLTTEAGMEAYRAEVERQLDLWSEDAMLDRIDELLDLISPHFRPNGEQRAFLEDRVAGQDDVMRTGLSRGADSLESRELRGALCMPEMGALELSFAGAYGSTEGLAPPGTCSVTVTWEGVTHPPVTGTHYAGASGANRSATYCVLPWGEGELLPYLDQPSDEHVPGAHVTEHTVTSAALYFRDASTGWEWSSVAWMEGTLTLSAAEATTGAAVEGSYAGTLWQPAW